MQVFSHIRFPVQNMVLVHVLISVEGQVASLRQNRDFSADSSLVVFVVPCHHLMMVLGRVLVAKEVVISLQGWKVG
jgi:hypothetical protein